VATIEEIEKDLQAVNAGIAGVKTAPIAMPGSLEAVQLPMALSYPGPGENAGRSFSDLATSRIWTVRVYVKEILMGSGVDEGYHNTLPFLERFRDEYSYQEHQSNGHWCSLEAIGDSGVLADMTLHNAPVDGPFYWGIEFRVRIVTIG
jgi:hypothetical protein